jgi:AcrR family transcriptional regulator
VVRREPSKSGVQVCKYLQASGIDNTTRRGILSNAFTKRVHGSEKGIRQVPRAPQSESERNQTRRRILDAAQALFDKAGIDAVSMRAIGKDVGLTAPALYAYYSSKTHLLCALWKDALAELYQTLRGLSENQSDPLLAIKEIGQAYAEFALENLARFRLLFMLDRHDQMDDLEDGGYRRASYDVLRQRAAEAIDRGLFRICDPDLVAQIIWTGLHGVLSRTTSSSSFAFLPTSLLIPSMIDTLLAGLQKRPSRA